MLVIVSLILAQIHPVSFRFVQIHSIVSPRSTQSHSDVLRLTQTLAISHRFAQPHTQIRSDSQKFSQSHSDSLDLVQTCSNPFRRIRIHPDSHSFTPASFFLPQTHPASLRFMQICSDKLQLTNPEGKREILPLPGAKGKGKVAKPPYHQVAGSARASIAQLLSWMHAPP